MERDLALRVTEGDEVDGKVSDDPLLRARPTHRHSLREHLCVGMCGCVGKGSGLNACVQANVK